LFVVKEGAACAWSRLRVCGDYQVRARHAPAAKSGAGPNPARGPPAAKALGSKQARAAKGAGPATSAIPAPARRRDAARRFRPKEVEHAPRPGGPAQAAAAGGLVDGGRRRPRATAGEWRREGCARAPERVGDPQVRASGKASARPAGPGSGRRLARGDRPSRAEAPETATESGSATPRARRPAKGDGSPGRRSPLESHAKRRRSGGGGGGGSDRLEGVIGHLAARARRSGLEARRASAAAHAARAGPGSPTAPRAAAHRRGGLRQGADQTAAVRPAHR